MAIDSGRMHYGDIISYFFQRVKKTFVLEDHRWSADRKTRIEILVEYPAIFKFTAFGHAGLVDRKRINIAYFPQPVSHRDIIPALHFGNMRNSCMHEDLR